MQPTNYRAYAKNEVISRRNTSEGRMNVIHDVHDVVAEGELKDGVASFTPKVEIDYVAFYDGPEGDGQVCLGRVDGPFIAGVKITVDAADIPEVKASEPVEKEVLVDGVKYRKAQ